MRVRKIHLAAAAALLVILAISVSALAADGPDLSWWLIGGGPPASAGAIKISGGVGQGVAGVVESGEIELCSGFWCAPPSSWTYQGRYLPLVHR